MANRRFGNPPGNQRGMSRGGFGPSSNINPWQGGVAPGNTGSNIQNQLALALTSFIQQSTQQQVPNDGPPSLLTMNTSPGYFNQDQFNNQNRFGNRGRQDFRRNEPYNKNRLGGGGGGGGNSIGWRSDQNGRNSGQNRGSGGGGNFQNKKKRSISHDKKAVPKEVPKDKVDGTEKAEKVEDNSDEKGEDGQEVKSTKFDGLPNSLLHCFVCNKSMWDGESFQNHVGGKAHKQMINSLEESFQITVNILRENMRLCEERKMIEFERMQRSRRYHHNNSQEPESHCNMCDLKFMGKIVVHRQTEGHQRLKRFLHPKCKRCNLEFPSRMEWVDHQFVPEHLFKLKEYLESKNLELGEFKLKVQAEIDNEPLLEENVQNEDDNPVMELSEDLANLFNRIPVFKPDRAVAKESLKAADGFICEVCQLFMPSEEESQTHLKSFGHYHAFVEAAKTKFQKTAIEKRRREEAEAAAAEETSENKEGEGKDDEAMLNLLNDIYDPFAEGENKEDGAAESEAKEEDKNGAAAEEKTATPVTRAKRAAAKNTPAPKSKKLKN